MERNPLSPRLACGAASALDAFEGFGLAFWASAGSDGTQSRASAEPERSQDACEGTATQSNGVPSGAVATLRLASPPLWKRATEPFRITNMEFAGSCCAKTTSCARRSCTVAHARTCSCAQHAKSARVHVCFARGAQQICCWQEQRNGPACRDQSAQKSRDGRTRGAVVRTGPPRDPRASTSARPPGLRDDSLPGGRPRWM